MKLTINHLAPYLPFDLKVSIKGTQYTMIQLSHGYVKTIETEFDFFDFNDLKPFLRPLSQLTQGIEHNGERLVPLKELFKAAFYEEVEGTENIDFSYEERDLTLIARDNSGTLLFGFDSKTMAFGVSVDDNYNIVLNQLHLFQKLHEWHFDLYGLIDAGLAIPIKS